MSDDPLTIEALERWEGSGAQWRVVDISEERVVVDLCTCTGEPVDQLRSEDPEMIRHLRTARAGQGDAPHETRRS
jgi:hypothetical protein